LTLPGSFAARRARITNLSNAPSETPGIFFCKITKLFRPDFHVAKTKRRAEAQPSHIFVCLSFEFGRLGFLQIGSRRRLFRSRIGDFRFT